MATSNGAWQNRARIEWVYTVSGSGSSRTVSVQAYLKMDQYASQFHNGTKSWSGAWGSGSAAQYYGLNPNQRVLIVTGAPSIGLNDTARTVSFTATANHFHGTTSSTLSVTLPAKAPSTPTGLSITRISDSSHRLNWTRSSTYTAVVVQRRVNGGAWSQVGRPTGNAATYTDNTTSVNNKYEYRVAGVSAGGQSGWSGIETVYTTPAAVGAVSAVKAGTGIEVTATGLPPYATAYEVSGNGALLDSNVTSWPWVDLAPDPAVTHTYTVVAKRGALKSAGRVSNTVQLQAAPLAPTGLAPNGSVSASDLDAVFAWAHNPVDTTAQTSYELRYRAPGGAWTTLTGTTAETRSVPFDAGKVEWQVRTKGDFPEFGPWSAVAAFTVVDRPGVAVLSPVGDVDVSFANVVWSWFQEQGRPQSAWRAELVRDGEIVEVGAGSGPVTEYAFKTALVDGGTYTVRVRAATGEVRSEWAVDTFTTVFPPPAPPVVVASWDDATGKHSIYVEPGELAVYAWLGDENESASTMTSGGSVTTNFVPNPLMSGSVTGWVSEGESPYWDEGLNAILGQGEGVYIDLGHVAEPVMSVRVDVSAGSTYRVAVFDPTGTSVAHWSETHSGSATVLMEGLQFTPGRPLRMYVSLDDGGLLRLNKATVVGGTDVTRAFDGNSQDEIATEYMTVERSIDGVTWEAVADNLVGENAIQDGEGLSNGSTWYRVTAFSSLPSAATTIVEVVSDSGALWLSGDEQFATTARLPYNPEVQISSSRDRVSKRYSGREKPVIYSGESLYRTVQFGGSILMDDTDVAGLGTLERIAQSDFPVHLYRDPDGRRVFGMLGPISTSREAFSYWSYSASLEESER